jgi:hypothetical protein
VVGQNGTFAVTGSHAYQNPGPFTITVQIADDAPGTATATATSSVNVTFTPSPRFNQQVLLSTLLQGTLESPGGAAAVAGNFAAVFGASALGSGLGQATDLVMNEMRYMFDFVLSLGELALGIKDPNLQAQITQLEFNIESSPLWQTPLGLDLGVLTKALVLEAAFPD